MAAGPPPVRGRGGRRRVSSPWPLIGALAGVDPDRVSAESGNQVTEAPEIIGVTLVHELERTPPLHSIHQYRAEWSVANFDLARVEACLEWNASPASTDEQAPDSGSSCSADDGPSSEFVLYGTFSTCKVKVMVKYGGTCSEALASDWSEEYSIDLDA